MHNLLNEVKFLRVSAAVAAGVDGAFVAGTEIDMKGFDNVLIIVATSVIAANGVLTSRVKNSDTSATYGAGTIDRIGANVVNVDDTSDNKLQIHDIRRPKRRYVSLEYQRTVGNVTIENILAIQYNGNVRPPVQAIVDAYQILNSPDPSTT